MIVWGSGGVVGAPIGRPIVQSVARGSGIKGSNARYYELMRLGSEVLLERMMMEPRKPIQPHKERNA